MGQFWLATVSNTFCFTGWTVLLLLPLYQEQRGLSRWEIGLVAGVYSLTGIFSRLPLGGWIARRGYAASVTVRLKLGRRADLLGPPRLILPGLFLMGLGTAALSCLTAHGWWLLLGAGLFIGAGHGLTYPALSTLANSRLGQGSGAATSLFMAAVEVGVLGGATGSGWLASVWGYHVTFLVIGAVALAATLGFYLLEK